MKYANILFDFDGTLADTTQGIIRTVQGTLKRMGYPEADPVEIVKTIGLPLADCFKMATEAPDERADEAVDIYREIFPDLALDSITLYPHILETLAALRGRGVKMAVVSSRHHISLDPLVNQLEIVKYIPIEQVYGEDENLRPKPAPDLTLKILKEMDLRAEETLVVGDTIYDLLMGSQAGCSTCGVTYGNQGREKLLTVKPDYLIDSFDQLLTI